ncbi:integrin alpha [Chloroflexota bacterium]
MIEDLELTASAGSEMDNSIDFLAPVADWYFESGQNGADLGFSVHAAGDLNADGFDDIVIGAPLFIAPGETEKDGAAFVFYGDGTSTPLGNTPDLVLTIGRKGSHFGSSVSTAGDVNGDSFDDLLVGADEYQVTFDGKNGEPKSGAVFLYMGSEHGLIATPAWTYIAEAPEIQLGYAVTAAGDVNKDGFDDILVGAPGFEGSPDQSNEGKVYLFLGSDHGLATIPDWTFPCGQATASCGFSASSAGDLNNDNFDDIIIGAPHYSDPEEDEGAAFIFLGSAYGPGNTPDRTLQSDQPGAEFGESVASAGDLDQDNYDDVLIGAPGFDKDEEQLDYGAAYIFRGSPTGTSTYFNWIVEGPEPYSRFGHTVHSAGDVNLDGFADVLIGAHLYGENGTLDQPDEGAVFLYTGGPNGLTLTPRWSAYGNKAEAWFGFSAAPAGDVNGDGSIDLIVGAPNYRYDQKIIMGRAFVYLNTKEDFKEYYYNVFIPFIDN